IYPAFSLQSSASSGRQHDYVQHFSVRARWFLYLFAWESSICGNLHVMGDADEPKKISTQPGEQEHYAEEQRLGRGRIEFDELGNAVWVPCTPVQSGDVLKRLLDNPTLTISEDDSQAANQGVRENPAGLKKGYDPYDSGLLSKKRDGKKKDLRRLSHWIKSRKPAED
ncbi:MAG: hypothetical protein WAW79_03540, partial [Steroidobacteraceae bacterium]